MQLVCQPQRRAVNTLIRIPRLRRNLDAGVRTVPAGIPSLRRTEERCSGPVLSGEYAHLVGEGDAALAVHIVLTADGTAVLGCGLAAGDGLDDSAIDAEIGTDAVFPGADAGAPVVALRIDVSSGNDDRSAISVFTASDAGRVLAAVGFHVAAGDGDGRCARSVATADAGGAFATPGIDGAAGDVDGAGVGGALTGPMPAEY